MTEHADLPEPGWYPDPSGSAVLRWWNGVAWSDATHPLPGQPQVQEVPAYPELFGGGDEAEPSRPPRSGRGRTVAVLLVVGLLVVAAVAVVALVSALSARRMLDTGAVEQQIADKLSAKYGVTITVDCPETVRLEAGGSFTCTAVAADGRTGQVKVTQDDDQGNVTFGDAT